MTETSAPPRVRPRRPVRRVTVLRTAQLTPSFRRVVLTGDMLTGFALARPACHVKLVLPPDGEADIRLEEGPHGLTLPQGPDRPDTRTYTVRAWDADALELTVDVALSHAGPAARWAASCAPGDRLAVAGPGGGYEPDDTAPLLLAGDETALPAIATILEATSRQDARTIVEVPTRADAEALDVPTGSAITVSARDVGDPPLAEMLASHRLDTGCAVWIGAEAGVIRQIRNRLLQDGRVDPDRLVTRGYWRRGTADHPDHDHGTDDIAPRR